MIFFNKISYYFTRFHYIFITNKDNSSLAVDTFFYTYALWGIKISIAYPAMVGGGFVIIAVVAWLYLGETLATGQWVGIVFIMAGVYLVARQMQPQAGS